MKKVLMGTEAAAAAARLSRVQVVSAYPITPQTGIVEELSNIIGRGELEARFMNVESEHSAMASCVGASAAGARTFTATSSQGLALMHEVLHYASGGRLPIVMVNANRALTPPWNLYCDHTDSLSQRDTGWIQYYCQDAQDVLDSVLISYRVAEKVSLPVMVNMDAFYLTHTSELVDIPDQARVDDFLPPFRPDFKLDTEKPGTLGNVCGPDLYSSFKFKRQRDMLAVEEAWQQAALEFKEHFGRFHPPVETYRTDDAEIVVAAIGTAAGAVRLAVDRLRADGIAAGALRPAMIRPFPKTSLEGAVPRARHLVTIDRDISIGAEGILAQEMKAAWFDRRGDIEFHGFIAGIGGNDVTADGIVEMIGQVRGEKNGDGKMGESYWAEVLA